MTYKYINGINPIIDQAFVNPEINSQKWIHHHSKANAWHCIVTKKLKM